MTVYMSCHAGTCALESGCCVSCVGLVFGFLIPSKQFHVLKAYSTKQGHKCHVCLKAQEACEENYRVPPWSGKDTRESGA